MRWMPLLATVCFALQVVAQNRPTLVSPEVLPNRSIILRLWAPKASEVKLSGNWMGSRPPIALTKGDDGVWTVTVSPLEPNIYSYGLLSTASRPPIRRAHAALPLPAVSPIAALLCPAIPHEFGNRRIGRREPCTTSGFSQHVNNVCGGLWCIRLRDTKLPGSASTQPLYCYLERPATRTTVPWAAASRT